MTILYKMGIFYPDVYGDIDIFHYPWVSIFPLLYFLGLSPDIAGHISENETWKKNTAWKYIHQDSIFGRIPEISY